jgi:hypothetical protein
MGAGNQSLVPWALSSYGSQSASAYKCNVDANEAIRSQPCGSLCVYPTSPASLAVMVDTGFALVQPGVGFLLQKSGAPTQVNLAAPSSNSYYATIYWDSETNTCDAVYGATATSPTPVMPNYQHQVPLALVLLTTGQIAVQNTNIIDIRQWIGNAGLAAGTLTFNTSVQCLGLTDLCMRYTTGGVSGNFTLTLNNLSYGTRLQLTIEVGLSLTLGVLLAANTPDGLTIPTYWADRGGGSNAKVAWNATTLKTFSSGSAVNFYPMDGFWVEQPGSGSPYLLFA